MKRIGLVGVAIALASCSLDASEQQYEDLEEQAKFTADVTASQPSAS